MELKDEKRENELVLESITKLEDSLKIIATWKRSSNGEREV